MTVKEKLLGKYEKISTKIVETPNEGSVWIANEIAKRIRYKQQNDEMCVLGLATGSSPKGVYKELIRLHKEEGLSFKKVITFNLDEYYPMQATREQSYVAFMHKHLFNHIDILPENIHIPDGTVKKEDIYEFCDSYESAIAEAGGLDLQILGIGRTGHIGFNEPGSGQQSPTRLISLDSLTISDAAKDFGSITNVPRQAITMGVGTIMQAKKAILMAWGEAKASIVKKALEENRSDTVPASYLQNHKNTVFVLDDAASSELTRNSSPWLVQECQWTDKMIRKAVTWLCQKLDKPVLKLTNKDYNDNHLSDLLALHGPAYDINIKVFNDLQHTISGWPGGKPNTNDDFRPEKATPYPKKVLLFSPHPGDDIIAMGGTVDRLIQQGHEVYVAYQTSGFNAVSDETALTYIDVLKDYIPDNKAWYNKVKTFITQKSSGDIDIEEVQKIKKNIREAEAMATARFLGLNYANLSFLDMPFYRQTDETKKNLTTDDIQIVLDTLNKIQPDEIFSAGDATDPNGTHTICWNAVKEALLSAKNQNWYKNVSVWLYRGAWEEWSIADIDMAVPMSPEQVLQKRHAIFKHQSQKDILMLLGNDVNEYWQRAEGRNKSKAKLFDHLGMAEYEALEVFKRFK